jgi:hypothetical protein
MLMALSLSLKLGTKYNLLAFSLHPGVISTNLGSHLDWNSDVRDLRMFPHCLALFISPLILNMSTRVR